jgi:hypothetical protein
MVPGYFFFNFSKYAGWRLCASSLFQGAYLLVELGLVIPVG